MSFYERLVARRIAEARRKRACTRNYDGLCCVLETPHDDWHQDSIGRRWP